MGKNHKAEGILVLTDMDVAGAEEFKELNSDFLHFYLEGIGKRGKLLCS